MSDLGKELFAEGRQDHRRWLRWQAIVILLFAVLHVVLIAPLVDATVRRTTAEANLAKETARKTAIDNILAAANAARAGFVATVQTPAEQGLQDAVEGLQRLDRIVVALRSIGPERAAGLEGDMIFTQLWTPPRTPPAQIFANMPAFGGPHFSQFDANMRRAAADQTIRIPELRKMLNPWIIDTIFDPAFAVLNSDLDPGRDKLAPLFAAVDQKIADAVKAGLRKDDPVLTEVRGHTENAAAALQSLHYSQPADPLWWTTLTGKSDGFIVPLDDLKKSVQVPQGLTDLGNNAAVLVIRLGGETDKIAAEIADLEKSFNAASTDVAGAFGYGGETPITLRTVVAWFPLLLIAIVAGLIALQASALGQMKFATDLGGERDDLVLIGRLVKVRGTAGRPLNTARLVLLTGWLGLAVATVAPVAANQAGLAAEAVVGLILLVAASLWAELKRAQADPIAPLSGRRRWAATAARGG
jgi:hypothetical protein